MTQQTDSTTETTDDTLAHADATAEAATVLGGGDGDAAIKAGEGAQDGDSPADGKSDGADAKDSPRTPPEKYELTPPEGSALDADAMAAAEPAFREIGLTNDEANKLLPAAAQFGQQMFAKGEAAAQQALVDGAVAQRREWFAAFEADPEFGGANMKRTIDAVARAFDHYGIKAGEGVRALLDDSGLGNHPDLIRFVAMVGRDVAEGGFERGGVATAQKTPEQKLYGDAFQPKS